MGNIPWFIKYFGDISYLVTCNPVDSKNLLCSQVFFPHNGIE